MNMLRRFAAILLLPALLGCSSNAVRDVNEQRAEVNEAAAAVSRLVTNPDFKDLRHYIKNAKAVLIIPDMYRAGFVVGGEYGYGVLMVKTDQPVANSAAAAPTTASGTIETDDLQSGAHTVSGPAHNLSDPAAAPPHATVTGWGNPLFYQLSGGSFGLQIGGQAAEIVITIMTDKGLQKLLNNSLKLGADLSIAVGPIGQDVAAGTALAASHADMYTFGSTVGLYGGASLSGAVLSESTTDNVMVYGPTAKPEDIMLRTDGPLVEAQNLRAALNQ